MFQKWLILFFKDDFTKYDKKPCNFAPEWFGPVIQPALKQTVFSPSFLPYSWTIKSAYAFETPKKLCVQLSIENFSSIPLKYLSFCLNSHLSFFSITLSLFQMTYVIRLVRAEMMEILQTDYIKFAKARGIKKNVINYKHALKNGLIPVITITGINIGTLIAFSIITETVFQWPGMGSLFINAVYFVDIPIMSAYMIMVAFIFVMINFIVDIAYYFIDPRIRLKEESN